MAKCKHHHVCGRHSSEGTEEDLCILHSENPKKDENEFQKALAQHRAQHGNRFHFFVFPRADFSGATFARDTSFRQATFPNCVSFTGATFKAAVDFDGAQFAEEANFLGAQFAGKADFHDAQFRETPIFDDAQWSGEANFAGAKFTKEANFRGAKFTKGAYFQRARFTLYADFSNATFTEAAVFSSATFTEGAWFSDTTFAKNADFSEATFALSAEFGGAVFIQDADFSRVMFTAATSFNNSTFKEAAYFLGSTFTEAATFGGTTFSRNADFGYADFSCPSFFNRSSFKEANFLGTRFTTMANFWQARFYGRTAFSSGIEEDDQATPVFGGVEVDFRDVIIEPLDALAFRNVDLQKCCLQGTDLRKAEITNAIWPEILPRICPTIWPRIRTRFGVYDEIKLLPGGTDGFPHIERLYRELKQNFEDRRDHERAGDFHYGEKEMRRKNPNTPLGRRFLLWLYWLVSGYGERWVRPLIWAGVVLVVSTFCYLQWGLLRLKEIGSLLDYTRLWETGLYSLKVMTLLKPSNFEPAGFWGDVVNTLQSFLGPILIGLFSLALRQRLRR